ncbi:transposase [Streptomyces sp. NPDC093509]|uniref:transposase n=1 Tax=Streptomyces sp. NPDC093509 TaxID=3154982 RepID=UPI003450FB7C
MAPTSGQRRGRRHRSLAGRPAEGGRQTPSDPRRTRRQPQVITTAANVNDVTQTLALVDGVPPVAGRPGRPRRRPKALLGDKGHDSNPNRDELRERRILPVISRRGAPNIKGMDKLRYVVEQTFPLLHQFKQLPVCWEHRTELHDAFASLAGSLICWRRLNKPDS